MPGIDIYNLEAEAYGGVVENPAGSASRRSPSRPAGRAADLTDLRRSIPAATAVFPMEIGVAARLARAFPEPQVRVPVSGPFSIASNLVGFENLLCDVADDPDDGGWSNR